MRIRVVVASAILAYLFSLSACLDDEPPSSAQNISPPPTPPAAPPPPPPSANGVETRSVDGSGNNPIDSKIGASFIQLIRLGPAAYADGFNALAGPTRMSARAISNIVVAQDDDDIPNPFGTSDFIWQWGQFVDHDLDLTDGVLDDGPNGRDADIPVPAGDPFFDPAATGTQVIEFNRALIDPGTGTGPGNPRQQENEITAWIDASNVYGSDQERFDALRVGPDSPFLRVDAEDLMPRNTNGLPNANGRVGDPTLLFLAGDVRANEQVGLAAMHTLFVREHNRLAAIVMNDLPDLSSDEVFFVARRLVGAEMQIITYNEFLPALLGPNALPPYTGYDPLLIGSIANEFSAAAYRFGHSALSRNLLRLDASFNSVPEGPLPLRDAFFNAPLLLQSRNDLDPILRGLAQQLHQRIDVKVVDDLRNFLFGPPGAGGFDLPALNIQRGRDHGLPSYNDTRENVGLPRVTSFAEISSDPEVQTALETAYGSVDDIDLWVGGLAEDPVASEGSQLGPLFRAILVDQFVRLREGDRFWWENNLTTYERSLVQDLTLGDIIRANTDIGLELQDNVFLVP